MVCTNREGGLHKEPKLTESRRRGRARAEGFPSAALTGGRCAWHGRKWCWQVRGRCLYYSGSQGIHDLLNPVVLVGSAVSSGRGCAKGGELEQGKVKVMEMPRGNWLDWFTGSRRGPQSWWVDQLWLDFTVRSLSLLVWIGMQLTSIQHAFTSLPACC